MPLSERVFTIHAPATTANLGPCFDVAGLALDLELRVNVRVTFHVDVDAATHQPTMTVDFTNACIDAGRISRHLQENLLLQACVHYLLTKRSAEPVLSDEDEPPRQYTHHDLQTAMPNVHQLHLLIDNQIPLARGLGSSSAAIVAGVILGWHLSKLDQPTPDLTPNVKQTELLPAITAYERHVDNVGPCLLGGLVVGICTSRTSRLISVKYPTRWVLVCAIPAYALSTHEARACLPQTYTRKELIFNLQRATGLMTLLSQPTAAMDDEAWVSSVRECLKDAIHQRQRCGLIPGLQALLATTDSQLDALGVLGWTLSGAGPTVLGWTFADAAHAKVASFLRAHFNQCHVHVQVRVLAVSERGARVTDGSSQMRDGL